jgi:DNA-directed RNA polymerase subunit beta
MSQKNNNQRINFATSKTLLDYPDLLTVQVESFKDFFQLETTAENRKNEGLYKVFKEVFPIEDTRNNYRLDFLDYFVDPPKYNIEECLERGLTYSVSLKARLVLTCSDPDHADFNNGTDPIQTVYLGNIPYMTPQGTFVINGAERIIVSQLHRSPGVFFGESTHSNGTPLYSARIIPFKGSWIEFATDINNVMYAYIDRKKKLPVTTLLRAIGYDSDKKILDLFNLADEIPLNEEKLKSYIGRELAARVLKTWNEDFVDEDTGEVVYIERTETIFERGTRITLENIPQLMDSGLSSILLRREDKMIDEKSKDLTVRDFEIIFNTLQKDTTNTEKEAIYYTYRQLRNSEPPDEATARDAIDKLFFSDKRYDLGEVGRYRLNKKLFTDKEGHLSSEAPQSDVRTLTKEDIKAIIEYLVKVINQKEAVDDIDHLSNRRIRTVGEQLANQFSVGLTRMARTVRERMNVRDSESFTAGELINAKSLSSVINSFFGTSQLSQFMDQTNPLAEMSHKRRLSSLGPGGLSRDRAGFEVRDVHYTHYGRLCPIETPEGPNIGLISSLCIFARINRLGFIETPYRKVDDGKVDLSEKGVDWMSAEEEDNKYVAQANCHLDDDGNILDTRIKCRYEYDYPEVGKEMVDYIDVAPNQIASVAAALIPFLEHDDAHRALMGSNMMRQGVPIIKPEAPIVGTGLEGVLARDSRTQIIAAKKGEVVYVDARTIKVKYDQTDEERFVSFAPEITTYDLPLYRRTNQDMSITLKPIVRKGDKVVKGQIMTEGYATEGGELALGRNLLVAFMPWKGYNYEDAVVLSERMVREDILTSIHVDEYQVEVRDTKRGMEELTNDIPNVSEDTTKDLDKNGIIRIGATVKPGDILIGKITPKAVTEQSPEEKLLRAIFGDKAGDVKDSSLKANPSLYGTVIDTKLFSRVTKASGPKKSKASLKSQIDQLDIDFSKNVAVLKKVFIDKMMFLLKDKPCGGVKLDDGKIVAAAGSSYTREMLEEIKNYEVISSDNKSKWTNDPKTNKLVKELINNYVIEYKKYDAELQRAKSTVSVGDELPSGIMQLAKVYVAKKRKIRVGDKVAGRHGNKGIVAKIVRDEDMPFLDDGTQMDILLSPMGVPSRMNLGQIYETVLGWAGQKLGLKFATPVFDGGRLRPATESQYNPANEPEYIDDYIKKAGLPENCEVRLRNGETGEYFDQKATVGIIYMIKLGHMVEDKMHARSIGPYSLITQQPLGGKAQFGGQRFGEMEVWALEGFGAAHALQEILTIKSDDVTGRSKAYEAIVKGEPMPVPGIPESLNVLLAELRGLALSIKLE